MRKELAILDHQFNARAVHVHDASGADVKVAHLAVAHLTVGQADVRAAGVNQSVGILAEKAVVGGLASQRDGIGFGFSAVSPSIENDEDEWFGTGHRLSAFSYQKKRAMDLRG